MHLVKTLLQMNARDLILWGGVAASGFILYEMLYGKNSVPLSPLSPSTPPNRPPGLLPLAGTLIGKTTRPDTTAPPDVYNPFPSWPYKWRYIAPGQVGGWPTCPGVFGQNFQPVYTNNYTGCAYQGEGPVVFMKTNSYV